MKKFIAVIAISLVALTSSVSATIIDFNAYTIDSYGVGQDLVGTVDVSVTGSALTLTGNIWKSISLGYTVTSNTLLNFEFFSSVEGEIHNIGFDNDNHISADYTFSFFGSQRHFGIQDFRNNALGQGWNAISIDVGTYYTGNFDRLFFGMDEDRPANLTANSLFRNVEICESGSCVYVSAPASLAIFGLMGLVFIGLHRRV